MNKLVKIILTYAGIVLLFVFLAYSFVPQVLGGKVVDQSDITGFKGMAMESIAWDKAHPDDPARWTGSMFGGMPNTSFRPDTKGDLTNPLYSLLFKGKIPANWLIVSLLGAFLLMLALGVDKFLAIGGAVAVTFCSYNFQIIAVGHNTKMQAIALFPWVLAAVIFTYKSAMRKEGGWKEWLPPTVLGAALFGLALSLQIKANHQQITYYLALTIALYVIALFVSALAGKDRWKKVGRFLAASAFLLVIGVAGIGTNANKLAPLYQYTKHTMRGGSELSHPTGGQINNQGLQIEYATAWSYGWEELPNLMIPNFNGGSSAGPVDPDKSAAIQVLKQMGQKNVRDIAKAMPMYWGPQPFTAGPMYMGAITVFLFLLGLFLYKGKEKWWLLAATILAVFLAVGNHFMWFTRLFFDHMPMYNKFRTVSMALIILQFTLPALGFMTLDKILKQGYTKSEFTRSGLVALALTAGFCLLCVLLPGIAGTFTGGASDASMPDVFVDALRVDRRHLLVVDALWAMVFILLAYGLILLSYAVPDKAKVAVFAVCLLVFVNMFAIGKRYLNDDSFTTPRHLKSQFDARPVDKLILEDKDPSYRVVDLTADIFNDSFTPYWHKSVGGYSPAKLQRYQDLIERYISKEIEDIYSSLSGASTIEEMERIFPEKKVLSALNTKYFIVNAGAPALTNRHAFGNAWFVDSVVEAANPDEEIGLIGSTDLRATAIIGADFKDAVPPVILSEAKDLPGTIRMTYYSPNELRYHYSILVSRPVVFSEIYYPEGWSASVESGEEVDLFRTDWVLRGAVLPAGEHDLVMRFAPEVYSVSENVSRASSLLLLILLAAAIAGVAVVRKKGK
ncbi:MAG: hypothetical protein IJK05_03245 [Bacteroidales bacterium]|nr:hypothetical protein [Bacteroidales bacterium]